MTGLQQLHRSFLVSLIFISSVTVGCSNDGKAKDEPEVTSFNYGDIAIDAPAEWSPYVEPGKYCVFLPTSFQQVKPENMNSGLRQFKGPLGVVSIMYSDFSTGIYRKKNAILNGQEAAIQTIVPIKDFPAYHEASMVYSLHLKANKSFFFDIVFYSYADDEDYALKLFGAARTSENCL